MKTCRECIHFNACEDWARSRGTKGLGFPWEYSDDDNLCDNYNSQTLPPAYIGMKVWVPYVWMSKEVITDLREGMFLVCSRKRISLGKLECLVADLWLSILSRNSINVVSLQKRMQRSILKKK